MEHRERFYATIERRPVDRPCTWLGLPDPAAHGNLFAHFQATDMTDLIVKLGDDVFPVELPYHSPVSDAIYAAFDFAKKGRIKREHRTLNAPSNGDEVIGPIGFTATTRCGDHGSITSWPDGYSARSQVPLPCIGRGPADPVVAGRRGAAVDVRGANRLVRSTTRNDEAHEQENQGDE